MLAEHGQLDDAKAKLNTIKIFEKDIPEITSSLKYVQGREALVSLGFPSSSVEFKENARRLADAVVLIPGDSELRKQLDLFSQQYQEFVRAQCATRNPRITDLDEMLKSVGEIQSILPDPSFAQPAKSSLQEYRTSQITALISQHRKSGSPFSSYLASALVEIDPLRSAGMGHVAGDSSQAVIGVNVRASSDSDCLGGTSVQSSASAAVSDLQGVILWDKAEQFLSAKTGTKPQSVLSLNVMGIRCAASTQERLNAKDVNSSYVLTQSQEANPEYTRLQTELFNAQIELNRSLANYNALVDPWARLGASFGVAAARGSVNRIAGRLNSTPPYFSEPVYSPYTYLSFEAVRSARVTGHILGSLEDSHRVLFDHVLSTDAESRDTGVSGTMPQDRAGVQDKTPVLRTEEALRAEAKEKFMNALKAEVRKGILEWSSELFADQLRAKNGIGALALGIQVKGISEQTGYSTPVAEEAVRFVNDFLFDTPDELVSLSQENFSERLSRLKPSRDALGQEDSRESTSRQEMQDVLERVLRAVVTIETEEKRGSGFLVSSDGLIVTNEHVISGARLIVARRGDSEEYLARVVTSDAELDLAILQIPSKSSDYLQLGTDIPRVGTEVWAVGSPLGLTGTVTRGIVSSIRRAGAATVIQIDAPINPGSSGGPLIDGSGLVIGVNTLKLMKEGIEGVGFALGADEVRRALPRMPGLPPIPHTPG